MPPIIPFILARAGWIAAGALIGVAAKSEFCKEAVTMFKDGVKGMGDDYRRDMSAKQKADIARKEKLVRDIRLGKQ